MKRGLRGRGGLHTQRLLWPSCLSLVVRRQLPGDAPGLLSLSPTPDLHEGITNMVTTRVKKKTFFFLFKCL